LLDLLRLIRMSYINLNKITDCSTERSRFP
jgi:hypothetical protein